MKYGKSGFDRGDGERVLRYLPHVHLAWLRGGTRSVSRLSDHPTAHVTSGATAGHTTPRHGCPAMRFASHTARHGHGIMPKGDPHGDTTSHDCIRDWAPPHYDHCRAHRAAPRTQHLLVGVRGWSAFTVAVAVPALLVSVLTLSVIGMVIGKPAKMPLFLRR